MTYELLEWDEPEPLRQGVGSPSMVLTEFNDPELPYGDPLDGFQYDGTEYSRPWRYYLTKEQKPPPPPPPEHEAWVVEVLQPVLEVLFPKAKPMQWPLFLPAETLTADADRCLLLGLAGFSEVEEEENKMWATFKEVVVLRHRKVVHVYNLVSHGRRCYRQLVWTSDSR